MENVKYIFTIILETNSINIKLYIFMFFIFEYIFEMVLVGNRGYFLIFQYLFSLSPIKTYFL